MDSLEHILAEKPYFKKIAYIFSLCTLIALISYQVQSYREQNKVSSYIQLRSEYENLKLTSNFQEESIKALLDKNSISRPLYESSVVQIALAKDLSLDDLTKRSIERVSSIAPSNYLAYAQNTLLIQKKNEIIALQNAKKLEEKLISEQKKATALYAYNLLRIALLEEKLGNENIKSSWNKFLSYIQEYPQIPNQLAHLKIGQIDLISYIKAKAKDM
ncbi:MAG: hypothetical protein K0S74_1299 [Chlamydiales bacterium]|jgi:hypothetical protein|nr:hypothetical protein [Chlamydiales bacterium]